MQQYRYSATFPLLLNISGQPTYFMALKIPPARQDVRHGQRAAVPDNGDRHHGRRTQKNYLASLYNAGLIKPEDTGTSETPDS